MINSYNVRDFRKGVIVSFVSQTKIEIDNCQRYDCEIGDYHDEDCDCNDMYYLIKSFFYGHPKREQVIGKQLVIDQVIIIQSDTIIVNLVNKNNGLKIEKFPITSRMIDWTDTIEANKNNKLASNQSKLDQARSANLKSSSPAPRYGDKNKSFLI